MHTSRSRNIYLWSVIKSENSNADVLKISLTTAKEQVPSRFFGQRYTQFTGAQVYASAGDRFGAVTDKYVGPQRVIHVVPDGKNKKKCDTFWEGGKMNSLDFLNNMKTHTEGKW